MCWIVFWNNLYKALPKTEVVVRYTASPCEIIVMPEFVMALVPSALGQLVFSWQNSVLDMACFAVVL